MNQENFLQWFEHQLLKSLTEPAVIVIDNAPYHSMILNKIPNTSWTKAAIQDWLTNNSIKYSNQMLKTELLRVVAQYVSQYFLITCLLTIFFIEISQHENM